MTAEYVALFCRGLSLIEERINVYVQGCAVVEKNGVNMVATEDRNACFVLRSAGAIAVRQLSFAGALRGAYYWY